MPLRGRSLRHREPQHSLALACHYGSEATLRRTAFVAVQVSEWEGKCAPHANADE